MTANSFVYILLGVATIPFIYYSLALYSSWQFFRHTRISNQPLDYTPPVSNLKPIRGLDSEAYENFASYCNQDYPDYELLFGIGDGDEAGRSVAPGKDRRERRGSAGKARTRYSI